MIDSEVSNMMLMDSMSLKKRKRDICCDQDGRPICTAPDTSSSTEQAVSNFSQPFPINSHFQDSHQYNKLPTPPPNLYHRPRIAPITPSKKRRREHKPLQFQSPPRPIISDGSILSGQTFSAPFKETSQKLPSQYRIHLRGEYGSLQQPNTIQTPPIQKQESSDTLAPCHICHRRPTTRTVLDAYADCELCRGRACYVCLRECNSAACRHASLSSITDRQNSRSIPGCDDDMCWISENRRTLEPGDGGMEETRADTRGRKICSLCAVEGVTDMGTETVRCLVCVEKKQKVT